MWVATMMDMDDVQPHYVLGPFETPEQAIEEGDKMMDFLNARVMPGHARPHDWESWVYQVKTPNEVIIGIEQDGW